MCSITDVWALRGQRLSNPLARAPRQAAQRSGQAAAPDPGPHRHGPATKPALGPLIQSRCVISVSTPTCPKILQL